MNGKDVGKWIRFGSMRVRATLAGMMIAVLSACGGSNVPETTTGGSNAAKRSDVVQSGSAVGAQTVRGRIFGLGGVSATVTLGNQAEVLGTARTDATGAFVFTNVPYGNYFVKADAVGMTLSPAQVITVNPPTVLASFGALSQILSAPYGLVFTASTSATSKYKFHWDSTTGAQEDVAYINAPPVIQFSSESITVQNAAAASELFAAYNIVLSDEGVKWSKEAASRLLTTLGTLPAKYISYQSDNRPYRISKWVLTDQFLANDITIERSATGDKVMLSSAALVYATPRLVFLDGVPGRFYSKRLHKAVIRFVTQEGTDSDAAEAILKGRFGVSVLNPSYSQLTANTTHESSGSFAAFRPAELVELINSLEEMPDGFHKISGLNYLLRRAYGTFNPVERAAMSMAYPGAGYIEFSDVALTPTATLSPQRLILHEKTHFLWSSTFSSQIKNDWTALGGWVRNPSNAQAWITLRSNAFSSDYAHAASPDEDMAEAVADFIVNPDRLRARANDKFNFVRDRIFQGDRYVPVIRDDLTFQVVDLAPDYVAPGKVKSIDLTLDGPPSEYKRGTVTVELFGDSSPSSGAKECLIMFVSSSGKKNFGLTFFPQDLNGKQERDVNRTRLSGSFYVGPNDEPGYWVVESLECTDVVGNKRYSRSMELGGASIYVNNPPQVTTPPEYEEGSLSISELAPVTVQGHRYRKVQARWRVKPGALDVDVVIAPLYNVQSYSNSVMGKYAYDRASRTVTMTYEVPDYLPNGDYGVRNIAMWDLPRNFSQYNFGISISVEAVTSINLINDHPDSGTPPELDLNRLALTATPTKPNAPDGETTVKMVFYARDDVAGLDDINVTLINPQGDKSWFGFATSSVPGVLLTGAARSPYFPGDPSVWQRYEAVMTLPVGSVPGKWGVEEIYLRDKAGNYFQYRFVELVRFEVSK